MLRPGLSTTCALVTTAALGLVGALVPPGASAVTPTIIGSGSASAANMVNQWVADVDGQGTKVLYVTASSSEGRQNFADRVTDFGVTDLPYLGGDDVSERPYAYVPLVATGLALAYHLEVRGNLVRDLRLSGETLARIFTGQITSWDDVAIAADNNGRLLPATPIRPVVRADSAGATQVLTDYLASQAPTTWGPCNGGSATATPSFPLHCGRPTGSDVAASGADGVIDSLGGPDSDGAIGYVDNPDAVMRNLPVASVENAAGYFVAPAGYGVTVALGDAGATRSDPRSYPLAHYESAVVPTSLSDPRMSTAKRQSLVDFLAYDVCAGQSHARSYGYGSLPRNLVDEALTQIAKVAAGDGSVDVSSLDPRACDTEDVDKTAPPPGDCQAADSGPCGTPGPPTSTRAPSITGAVRVGATVTADAGDWSADTVSYRWLADGAPIAGATRDGYRVPAALVGRSLSLRVTGASAEFRSLTVTSRAKRVERGRLRGARLAIAGRPVVGRTLVVRGARIAGAGIRVQWYAAGRRIPGARSLRWTLRRAQLGRRVTVRVVASAPAYESLVRTSPRTRVVQVP